MRAAALLVLAMATPAAAQLVTSIDPAATRAEVAMLMTGQSQSVDAVLDASGNFTWTYPVPFTGPPRVAYFPQNPDTNGRPIVCNWQTRTATALTFHCDKAAGTLASLLNPLFLINGAAGATVTVTARGTLTQAVPTQ